MAEHLEVALSGCSATDSAGRGESGWMSYQRAGRAAPPRKCSATLEVFRPLLLDGGAIPENPRT